MRQKKTLYTKLLESLPRTQNHIYMYFYNTCIYEENGYMVSWHLQKWTNVSHGTFASLYAGILQKIKIKNKHKYTVGFTNKNHNNIIHTTLKARFADLRWNNYSPGKMDVLCIIMTHSCNRTDKMMLYLPHRLKNHITEFSICNSLRKSSFRWILECVTKLSQTVQFTVTMPIKH